MEGNKFSVDIEVDGMLYSENYAMSARANGTFDTYVALTHEKRIYYSNIKQSLYKM